MHTKNSVYIGVSLDGYIADQNGELEWLDSVPNPQNDDMGYGSFMDRIDALLMGKNTFEKVLSFGIEWPYQKKVFVLSNSLNTLPSELDQVEIVRGPIKKALETIHLQGDYRLYIDGGKVIQSFLKEDLIDEMIITTIPVLLGGGIRLFEELPTMLRFKCIRTEILLGEAVQSHYVRNHSKKQG